MADDWHASDQMLESDRMSYLSLFDSAMPRRVCASGWASLSTASGLNRYRDGRDSVARHNDY